MGAALYTVCGTPLHATQGTQLRCTHHPLVSSRLGVTAPASPPRGGSAGSCTQNSKPRTSRDLYCKGTLGTPTKPVGFQPPERWVFLSVGRRLQDRGAICGGCTHVIY